ncbi:hypothetical protein ACIBCN_37615 [Nocardia sp. NPDC051052]|uniref:hypothetical protein n=1 Tax=Nocardia sp. NPDC051052 TaxID=3364322 RepID=UPI003798BC1A
MEVDNSSMFLGRVVRVLTAPERVVSVQRPFRAPAAYFIEAEDLSVSGPAVTLKQSGRAARHEAHFPAGIPWVTATYERIAAGIGDSPCSSHFF